MLAGLSLIFFFFLLSYVPGSALGSSHVLRVQETELVKLNVEGIDPDDDEVIYRYSPPLNEGGEWQTTYGDAGEYNLKVTASDGEKETTKYVNLVVEKKNRPPQVSKTKITAREGEIVSLKPLGQDLEGDTLIFTFTKPFNSAGEWKTMGNDQGTYRIEFTISDGLETIRPIIEVEVLNVPQAPVIAKTFSDDYDIKITEDKTIVLFAEIDNDEPTILSYLWSLDNKTIGEEKNISYYFNYSSAGKYRLSLLVTGRLEGIEARNESPFFRNERVLSASKEWQITVAKKNRKPEFEHLPIVINEGETVKVDLPPLDVDGDAIAYTYERPLNNEGKWQTGFNESGKYRLKIEATDGLLNASSFVDITVLDVDRKPVLVLPEEVVLFEGQEWNLTVVVQDPDHDEVFLSAESLPEGMNLSQGILSWYPSHDAIKRKGGWFSDLLNALRLEHFFLKEETFLINVNACGRKECMESPMTIRLRNVNRPPRFISVKNISVQETELLSLAVEAVDPDGDIVHYYYTNPLSRRKAVWQTQKGDKGNYTAYVTATDGKEQATKPVLLLVKKKNTAPKIIVDDAVRVKEGQEFTLRLTAEDEDNDALALKLKNPPKGSSFKEGIFVWQPGFNSVVNKTDSWWNDLISHVPYLNKKWSKEKATTILEFAASDGEAEVIHPVRVEVVNVNNAPQIVDYLPKKEITALVGEPVVFNVVGKDADADVLTYGWSFSFHEPKIVGTNTVERTFVVPGRKKVEVVVSDGRNSVSQEWMVSVLEKEQKQIVDVKQKEPFTVQVYELEFKK